MVPGFYPWSILDTLSMRVSIRAFQRSAMHSDAVTYHVEHCTCDDCSDTTCGSGEWFRASPPEVLTMGSLASPISR